ncbi:MAG: hypothetical protein A4E31_00945 [Methanomassiliicoccales archaeon PtaU1.Bin030]|nr:MAG: hypothetical protein A4E31_00945 [Methanomassiliicoccales archaeon PtaU1.Bin030]
MEAMDETLKVRNLAPPVPHMSRTTGCEVLTGTEASRKAAARTLTSRGVSPLRAISVRDDTISGPSNEPVMSLWARSSGEAAIKTSPPEGSSTLSSIPEG